MMANQNRLPKLPIHKGRLPACTINEIFMQQLWTELQKDGDFVWVGAVGTGGDLLGKEEERPQQSPGSWEELENLLRTVPRIDHLALTVEVPEKGTIAIKFNNFAPPKGALMVTGMEQAWVDQKYEALQGLFDEYKSSAEDRVFSFVIFGLMQTVLPLSLSFMVITALSILLIPFEIRIKFWQWLVGVTMVATLYMAYMLSNRVVKALLNRYTYFAWRN